MNDHARDADLLTAALLAEPAGTVECWRQWREAVDPDSMSEDCVRLLPVLVTGRTHLLTGDPGRNLFLGICKRAWTRNQLLLRTFVELLTALERAGVTGVAAGGPVAWALWYQNAGSFRPIHYLAMIVSRAAAVAAAQVFYDLGWVPAPGSAVAGTEYLDYVPAVWLRGPQGEGLKLSWRLFPAPPELAGTWEILPPMERVSLQCASVAVPPPVVMLAGALSGVADDGQVDWRCDALLILRAGNTPDWELVRKWLRFAPRAHGRSGELSRISGMSLPALKAHGPVRIVSQWEFLWSNYCDWRAVSGTRPSPAGFIRFLSERWQVPVWKLPFAGMGYALRYVLPRRGEQIT